MLDKKNRQMGINLLSNIAALVINMGISFFLVPYVTENVGEEAYGFVTLGNNFVNYVTMATVALNAMAGRFVTIAIHRKEYDKANKYFSSVFYSNILMVLIILIPLMMVIWKLENILNISPEIIKDIKLLWAFIFLNLFLSLIGTVFSISTFCANRIDLSAKRNIEANIIKMVIVFIMFVTLTPSVWYWGFAIMISGVYTVGTNVYYTRKLIPEMKISRKYLDRRSIKEILSAGIWNTVSRVGSTALTEFDLLLVNLLISPKMMGIIALSKTLPGYVTSLTSSITGVFMPSLTIEYAKAQDNTAKLIKEVKIAIRVLLFFHCVIYSLLFGFFDVLYKVWMPSQIDNIQAIYIMGLLSIGGCFISAVSSVVMNIYTVVNKLKYASLSIVITGMISLPLTVFLANMTENIMLRSCFIVGISVCLVGVRCIFFLIPYAGVCIGAKWYTFLSDLALNIISIIISIVIAFGIKAVYNPVSWSGLFTASLIDVILVGGMAFVLVLPKEGKQIFVKKMRRVLKK